LGASQYALGGVSGSDDGACSLITSMKLLTMSPLLSSARWSGTQNEFAFKNDGYEYFTNGKGPFIHINTYDILF